MNKADGQAEKADPNSKGQTRFAMKEIAEDSQNFPESTGEMYCTRAKTW